MLRYITEKIPMQIGAKACTHSLTFHVLCYICYKFVVVALQITIPHTILISIRKGDTFLHDKQNIIQYGLHRFKIFEML